MVAVDFVQDRVGREPNFEFCERFVSKCLEKKILLLKAGKDKNIVRILSPLVITNGEIEKSLSIMEEVLKELTQGE
jgi:4-aminobutyrate aminotransferase/(S)-3-amino-2-methylpropionate transaminase